MTGTDALVEKILNTVPSISTPLENDAQLIAHELWPVPPGAGPVAFERLTFPRARRLVHHEKERWRNYFSDFVHHNERRAPLRHYVQYAVRMARYGLRIVTTTLPLRVAAVVQGANGRYE